jgi:5-enolpyruvylshikimate-3-phosphate synthase
VRWRGALDTALTGMNCLQAGVARSASRTANGNGTSENAPDTIPVPNDYSPQVMFIGAGALAVWASTDFPHHALSLWIAFIFMVAALRRGIEQWVALRAREKREPPDAK